MQLLHEQTSILTVKDFSNMNTIKDVSSHNMEVKEKRSSNASIFVMNPVASGDNMQTDLNSGQKLKEELPTLPQLVPCCEGKELQIREDLVHSGLSAISVKHDSVIQCLSMSCACERLQVPPGLVKHRNSFRSLHRPDLKRVPYLRRMTPDELEALFRGYADIPKREKRDDSKDIHTVLPCNKNDLPKKVQGKITTNLEEGYGNLHPIPETKSGVEDIPPGMRLHGARARLYTSVLAGAKTGDQLDNVSANEEAPILVEAIPEDDIPLYEELQIILPPRCDDVTAGSSTMGSENSI